MEKDRRGGLTKRMGAYMRWKDERMALESDPYEEGLGYCPGLRHIQHGSVQENLQFSSAPSHGLYVAGGVAMSSGPCVQELPSSGSLPPHSSKRKTCENRGGAGKSSGLTYPIKALGADISAALIWLDQSTAQASIPISQGLNLEPYETRLFPIMSIRSGAPLYLNLKLEHPHHPPPSPGTICHSLELNRVNSRW
ncbi:unnamed protein product [Nezara viridula]|uniref:Uncharacterized protein n=1 Tax=Nezara viridula TaxID=85310 RepID=A0A9P0H7P7_NEZVI|nr:unnamed protein product [Nezara viridula]